MYRCAEMWSAEVLIDALLRNSVWAPEITNRLHYHGYDIDAIA